MIALAALAGFAAGAWHLLVTAGRARAVGSGTPGLALLLAPLGMLGPVVAVLGMVRVAPGAVWAVLPGLLLARLVLVRPLARRMEEGAWR